MNITCFLSRLTWSLLELVRHCQGGGGEEQGAVAPTSTSAR